jgi:hypothetical protein
MGEEGWREREALGRHEVVFLILLPPGLMARIAAGK